jgi:hypothetical protein
VRILVGAPAGGSTDTMARAVAQAMGQQLGRTVVWKTVPVPVATWLLKPWPALRPMAKPC